MVFQTGHLSTNSVDIVVISYCFNKLWTFIWINAHDGGHLNLLKLSIFFLCCDELWERKISKMVGRGLNLVFIDARCCAVFLLCFEEVYFLFLVLLFFFLCFTTIENGVIHIYKHLLECYHWWCPWCVMSEELPAYGYWVMVVPKPRIMSIIFPHEFSSWNSVCSSIFFSPFLNFIYLFILHKWHIALYWLGS